MTDVSSFPSPPPIPAAKPDTITPPIDVSRIKDEKGVKAKVKQLLNKWGWFSWMPSANGYGVSGVSDFNAINAGVFLVIETKFGANKPTPLQKSYAGHIIANSGFAFVVTEKNLDHLAWWLESFAMSVTGVRQLKDESELSDANVQAAIGMDHGSRMMNAMQVLTAGWA